MNSKNIIISLDQIRFDPIRKKKVFSKISKTIFLFLLTILWLYFVLDISSEIILFFLVVLCCVGVNFYEVHSTTTR